jgi:hypothetical protein
MWFTFDFGMWAVLSVLFGGALVWCYTRESSLYKIRQQEIEEIKRIQNAEWEVQLREYPTLRFMLLSNFSIEERQLLSEEDRLWLEDQERIVLEASPVETDWKREGF